MLTKIAATELAGLNSHLKGWLLDTALPLWAERGYDRARGGFYDTLSFETVENTMVYKRLRVQARQVYVFAAAARFGFSGARDLVAAGIDYLLAHTRHPDGGFASRLSLDGAISDPTRDLYDLAFTLFALAHAHDVLGRDDLLAEAEALYGFIARELAHPAGGFLEGLPAKSPRRQNPHMHLLEACQAWASVKGGVWQDRAAALVALAERHFIDRASGALTEYFTEDWQPLAGDEGRIVEPGHQFEWVWLLAQAEKASGSAIPTIDGLYAFAWHHGVDVDTGLLRAELLTDGVPKPGPVRLWTHTEWLKGELAMYERTGAALHAARAVTAGIGLASFLACPRPGLWFERYDRKTGYAAEPSPASSLYHVTLAIAELDRVARAAG